eukprot:1260098-Alexandrium_andersonii.AAC.1
MFCTKTLKILNIRSGEPLGEADGVRSATPDAAEALAPASEPFCGQGHPPLDRLADARLALSLIHI